MKILFVSRKREREIEKVKIEKNNNNIEIDGVHDASVLFSPHLCLI